jgi:hypothetical protein
MPSCPSYPSSHPISTVWAGTICEDCPSRLRCFSPEWFNILPKNGLIILWWFPISTQKFITASGHGRRVSFNGLGPCGMESSQSKSSQNREKPVGINGSRIWYF